MSGYHTHPNPKPPIVYGRRLSVGEILQEGDVFASSLGVWEKITFNIGNEIKKNDNAYIVRPEVPPM